ncbi:LOW QUALITY PROTEIN: hypothetical protein ACG7TL_003089 [Trametes sanguinea]
MGLDEFVELVHALDALLVAVAKRGATLLLRLLQDAADGVQTYQEKRTFVKILKRRAKRETHEVVAGRVEEIPAMSRVDVEEDAGNDDRLLLQELFEERQTVVERGGEMLEVEPDVERRDGRDLDLEPELLETLQHVVAFMLEVLLEGDLLLHHALGVKEGDCGELERVVGASVQEGTGLRERGDQVLGAQNPADSPAWKTPVLNWRVGHSDHEHGCYANAPL